MNDIKIIELDEMIIPVDLYWFVIKNKDDLMNEINSNNDKEVFKVKLKVVKKFHDCLVYVNHNCLWVYDLERNGK